jgi:hypothetical protein
MNRLKSALLVLFCSAAICEAEQPSQTPAPAPTTARFPVKRVVLYKNGVGYFEHLGRVRGNQDVAITFTSGQLNDALKSLTVLDLGGGRVTGVTYNSTAPMDRQLSGLRLPLAEKTTLSEFLGALRGARLEVKSAATVIVGRLLSVERKTRISGGTTLEVDYMALITDTGEVKTTELSPAFSVRILDRGLAGSVNQYMDLLSSAHDADLRRTVISTSGTGERALFISYISEVPVWKTTYRIVLPSKPGQNPLLQGWAIVDNTVGEDWENVSLSLVAGAPQSFIQQLSQPYYARRPVVPLPESAAAAPQTYEASALAGGARLAGSVTDPTGAKIVGARVWVFDERGMLAGETKTGPDGTYRFPSLAEGIVRIEIESPGFKKSTLSNVAVSNARTTQANAALNIGEVAESVTVTAEASGLQTSTASVAGRGRLGSGRTLGTGAGLGGADRRASGGGGIYSGASVTTDEARIRSTTSTSAKDLGDLFEYRLKEPTTLRKNQSALVPIVNSNLAVEKVSIWNSDAEGARPKRALWLNNSTGFTLDGGSFNVLEDETFAGEGIFDLIRPGEKRLVSYATDLGLHISSLSEKKAQGVRRVRISDGDMVQESEIRERRTYALRNEDTKARTAIIEHRVRTGYELLSEDRPVETSSGWMRFRKQIDPKQTAQLVVEESRPISSTFSVEKISGEQLEVFVRGGAISKSIEEALRKILAQKEVVSNFEAKKSAKESDVEAIFEDQQRLRENIKSLKGSAEEKALLQRYTQQLNQQEDRLEALRKDTQSLQSQIEKEQTTLDNMIQSLAIDTKL